MSSLVVAVVGPGDTGASEEQIAIAREVGSRIAEAGATLVCGGLGGVMAAASEGARRSGGTVIGLLPGDDASAGNDYLSVAIPTGLGELRNGLIVRAADAVIAVGGGYGTLSEIGFALKTQTPVFGIGTWELRSGGRPDDGIVPAAGAEEAVALALRS